MANIRNANTFFVDSTGTLTGANFRVEGIIYTSTDATNSVIIKDISTGAVKFTISAPSAGETVQLRLGDSPVTFPNGVDIDTLTNATLTIIGRESTR